MKKIFWCLFCGLSMLTLILDRNTAINGCIDGINLCLHTVMPALFPFLVFSHLLSDIIPWMPQRLLTPLSKILRLSTVETSVFLLGLVSGYPVGARMTAQFSKNGSIHQADGRRMLAFCSNAGPAFIFGIGSILFPASIYCWMLWSIHILSAILVGVLTPGKNIPMPNPGSSRKPDILRAVRESLQIMAYICGWVILFRMGITWMERWICSMLPETGKFILFGMLELTNGVLSLGEIASIGVRFYLFAVFLAAGGLCVLMQTYAVSANLDTALYLPGKLLQAGISFCLCIPAQFLLPAEDRVYPSISSLLFPAITLAYFCIRTQKHKIHGSNSRRVAV